jgi:two-component system, cell cycle sensor histidine kinase and response regulator CckA
MKSLSLKSQILILVLTLVIIVLLASQFLTYSQIKNRLYESLEIKAQTIAAIISENVGPGLEFQDEAYIKDIVDRTFVDKDLTGLELHYSDHRIAFQRTSNSTFLKDYEPKSWTDSFQMIQKDHLLVIARPISLRNNIVGYLYLEISKESVSERLMSSLLLIISIAGGVLIIVIIASIIISKKIVKPIGIFESAAKRISDGDMISQVNLADFQKDFQPLGMAFNKMRLDLNYAFEELSNARDNLEIQVSERTAELNSELKERKMAEEALRQSETRFRRLFNTFYDSIFIVKDGIFIDCNARTLEMFDCTREQIIGEQPYMFSPEYQPDGRISKEKAIEKIMAAMQGEPQFFEWKHCTYDHIDFDAKVSLNRLDLGTEKLIIAYVKDITDRKKAEAQEQELQEKLDRAQRMESLGVLAGGVAHDLNNMLGPLVGYPELILERLPKDSPLRIFAQRIGKSARDAADVIQDLLTLARRGRYEMEPTKINDVVNNYFDSFNFERQSKEHPDIKIQQKLNPTIPYVLGSSPHLAKVVMNLVVNAYDATPSGGSIYVETDLIYLDKLIGGYKKLIPGEYVILRVKDTGTGIDPKDIDSVFEPYYSKKKMGRSGSGLGLSVVYGIIKDHNGYYDILSEVGKGTEFILYFPVSKKSVAAAVIEKKQNRGTESVLVVDDEENQREIARALLSSLGYNVETAANGHHAVEYLKSHTADIIILDMIMENDFDGLDTYREIIKIHPSQKAIIASGFSTTRRVDEMQKLGAGQYIRKPYTRDNISKAIREELDKTVVV